MYTIARILCAVTVIMLAACAHDRTAMDRSHQVFQNESVEPVSSPPSDRKTVAPDGKPTATFFPGTGELTGTARGTPPKTAEARNPGGITLNLVNADIRDAAKAILGDYLKRNYTIGANAQGTVTIQTSTPISREEILPLFEQSLRLNGLALVTDGSAYRILPIADATKEAATNAVISVSGATQPGFGVQLVSLKFVSAQELARLLTPLAPAQAIIQVDTGRNALIIQGSERERAALLDSISLFDVDWLAGMSFALFTPKYSDAQSLAKDLSQVIGGANAAISNLIRLVPIERLNAVLAISPQLKYLQDVQQWVERLDRPGQGTDKKIFIYSVQNGRASDVAAVLIKTLGAAGARSANPVNAVEPLIARAAGPGADPGLVPQPQSPAPALPPGLGPMAGSLELSDVSITADERTNAIVIRASPQEYSSIESALRELDTVPLQVLLEAAIVEVTLTKDLQYGVQYFYQPGKTQQLTLSSGPTDLIGASFPGFSYAFSQGTNIKVILDALSSVTRVEVISSPELLVLNNQPATLQVGDRVPIVSQQAISTLTTGAPLVNNVQYLDTGVILKVTPRVNRGGMVMMDISQEVSNVAATTSSNIDSPTIQQRKIESTVAVHDSETVALGGLIMDNKSQTKAGIPFVQDIPVLGNLFRDTQNNASRTELMVLVTPHVLDSIEKARAVTQELRQKLPAVQLLLRPSP